MERSIFCKVLRDAVIDLQSLYKQSNVNRLLLNVIDHLENTSMPCGPFCTSSFDVRAWVCNQNALFNQLIINTGHRSTQLNTGQLCIFNKNRKQTQDLCGGVLQLETPTHNAT